MLAAIGLALAGLFGLCTLIIIGSAPVWMANAADGDLAMLGILDDGTR